MSMTRSILIGLAAFAGTSLAIIARATAAGASPFA